MKEIVAFILENPASLVSLIGAIGAAIVAFWKTFSDNKKVKKKCEEEVADALTQKEDAQNEQVEAERKKKEAEDKLTLLAFLPVVIQKVEEIYATANDICKKANGSGLGAEKLDSAYSKLKEYAEQNGLLLGDTDWIGEITKLVNFTKSVNK